MKENIAILAGGCFWCLEPVFTQLAGVREVVSGYTGGFTSDPTYKQVCTGTTGHAEAIQISFDPAVISYEALLEVFFTAHDPTTPNRQGNDIGTQYRSAIFYLDDEQKAIAEQMIARVDAENWWPDPVVTEVTSASIFYPAEDYHQYYYVNNSNQPYCQAVAAPKIAKIRAKYGALLKSAEH
ncbi:MAG: peptide-methionine (S)-S-oxide reductase [Betaproteobacteria bacterium HGW-Betaproteobacteria-8]|nr:MAG: peptide-methionine (S)-S-oxide reductase [Betaproteobacteria bacterium HGW-Betaproteobacteria-8]